MNRAFHIAGMVWLGTVLAAGTIGFPPAVGALAGALLLAAVIAKGKLPLWVYAAAAAFCASFVGLMLYNALAVEPARRYENTTQTLRGVVVDWTDYVTYSEIVIRTDREGAPEGLGGARIRMTVNAALDVTLGDVVNYKVRLTCDENRRMGLYAQNLRFTGAQAGAFHVEGSRPADFEVRLARYRNALCKNITRQLPGDEGDVLAGMLVGRTERISPDLRADYARAGISHLLAVSGLHLSILTGLADCVLRCLPFSRRQRALLTIAAVAAFMALTGFSHSVVRAGVMMILCASAGLFGQDADSLNSLGLALVLILAVNPYAAFSTGLLLSYLATMGIAAFARPLTDWICVRVGRRPAYEVEDAQKWLYHLLRGACATVCATVLTAPLVCWMFGELSLAAPLVNAALAPTIPLALGCGMLMGFTGFFPGLSLLTRALGLLGGLSVKTINETAAWWAGQPFAAVPVRTDTVILWMAAVLAGGVLLWAGHARPAVKRYAASLAAIVLCVVLLAHEVLWSGTLELAAVSYGGSAALICGKQGAVIGVPESTAAARNLRALLGSRGVERIVLLVAEKDDQLYSNAARLLGEGLPVDTSFGLDRTDGFEAVLFGDTTLSAVGRGARYVSIDAGGLRIVKEFEQRALPADLLINARNEMIRAPGLEARENDRYFNSRVITLRRNTHEVPVGK